MECLRSKSIEVLIKAQYKYTFLGKISGPYDLTVPVFDGELLQELPRKLLSEGRFTKRDVMIGICLFIEYVKCKISRVS